MALGRPAYVMAVSGHSCPFGVKTYLRSEIRYKKCKVNFTY